jgi:D-tyrosyl-tRNA(Tyr) deacylase
MKAVVQRVRNASVTVDGAVTGAIARGLLVYLGVAAEDTEKDADWLAEKIANLRIFQDAEGKMNLSLIDIVSQDENQKTGAGVEDPAGILTISQFTLLADDRKGRRPYYGAAAEPEKANTLYKYFMEKIREQGLVSRAGVFQAHMDVGYINDGPVTIILDSRAEQAR